MSAIIVRGLAPRRGWIVVEPTTGRVVCHCESRKAAKRYARARGWAVGR